MPSQICLLSATQSTHEKKRQTVTNLSLKKQTARKKFLLRLNLNMMKFRKCHRSMNTTPMKIIRSRKILRSPRTIRQMNCQKTPIVA
ncbi:hypothetical protein [Coprococcus eutactus]|uniref:hypothetical protein n=1 Tax=Coprococcus eutactus TaxID=33043 RepID=UPI00321C2438